MLQDSGFSDAEGVFKVRSYSWIMFIFLVSEIMKYP